MLLPGIFFLKDNEQLLIEGLTRRWTVNGPKIFWARPGLKVQKRSGIVLGATDYLHIRDTLTGEFRSEFGPKLYFLQAHEEMSQQLSAIPLQSHQYIRIFDQSTGMIRVARGENLVYLHPREVVMEAVQEGINIDEQTAVLVRDRRTGQLELICEPQVFCPAANQEIVEKQQRMVLEIHETVVIKDLSGHYIFKRGTDEERTFFLAPYWEVIKFYWSSGIDKDSRNLEVIKIDSRPRFMWYDFEARTQDNVELLLGITFFWQIFNVESLIHTTNDPTGDICSHARSVMIQAISQVPLEQFLANFNVIIPQAIMGTEDNFYQKRGLLVHAVAVRSIACKDPRTQNILLERIQATTHRLNLWQKQAAENEVKLQQIQGEIKSESEKRQLLELRRQHTHIEAITAGEAEAMKVKAFLEGLGNYLSLEEKLAIFKTLRKQDAIKTLSLGNNQLYLMSSDIDLMIETKQD